MIKRNYKLQLYPNRRKGEKLDQLIKFWKKEVNRKIEIFWKFDMKMGKFPSKEYLKGGRLVSDASKKAWQIVKGAKKTNSEKPIFKGNEIDLNQFSAYIINNFKTKEFDLWFNVISLMKNKRLKIPSKKYKKLNEIIGKGKLSKSFKILKRKNDYFIQIYLNFPEIEIKNDKFIGIDVGLTNTVALSDGNFYGNDLKDLRIRTKWRSYDEISPFKQGLNRVANQLILDYPNHDFAVEKLNFKGKKKRTKLFRRRNNNWAYSHLSNQLTRHGELEGFKVFRVEPEFTSQTCPVCDRIGKRQYNEFTCECGFVGHADVVGAMNIVARIPQESAFLNELTHETIEGGG